MILRPILVVILVGSLTIGAFLGARKVIDMAGNRARTFGAETLVQRGFTPLEQWGKRDTEKSEISEVPIIVEGQEVRVIKDTDFFQKGDIIIKDNGKLIFINSVIEMTPKASGEKTSRANIFVRDKGEIVFENSTLKPHSDDPANLYVNLSAEARFVFNDSQGIHMLIATDNSEIKMNNSTWAFSMSNFHGGGVRVQDAVQAYIKDSQIGGLVLEFSEDARVNISGFRAGTFEKFSVQENFSTQNVDFNVTLENTEILGDYHEGEAERGLSIFAPTNIQQLRISDSELNTFVVMGVSENMSFDGLRLGAPQDFSYRNIKITNSSVMARWGFFLRGGRGIFINSQGLWFSLYGDAELTLVDSSMNKFDPRAFRGIIDLQESIWKNAGAIIGDNDFTWRGDWIAQGFAPEDFHPLLWADSRIVREFSLDVASYDPEVIFISGARVEIQDPDGSVRKVLYADKNGRAYFSISFDDANYKEKFLIKVASGDREISHPVSFLTPTPIKLILK